MSGIDLIGYLLEAPATNADILLIWSVIFILWAAQ